MAELDFHTLDVFTERPFAGNPLAVVLDADGLDEARMQLIAREFNLSETVFVCRPSGADAVAALRIFTPARELPFAGHPTVGTACLLAELGRVPRGADAIVLEERVGPVPVRLRQAPGRAPFAQLTTAKLPEYGPQPPPLQSLAPVLGLPPDEIVNEGHECPRTVSCGVPFLLLPLRDMAALARVRLDTARCRELLQDYVTRDLYLYTREAEHPGAQLRARMFAPELGIAEDPATGGAAVALAGALATESAPSDGSLRWVIEQGIEMGRPSLLYAEADKQAGRVSAVRVGGHAVRIASGRIRVPERA